VRQERSLRLYDAIQDVRQEFSRIGCLTSAALILLGAGLDQAIYPERAGEFFLVRLATALATLWVMRWVTGPRGKQYIRSLTLLWLVLPQIMIAWMIYSTEGVASIYFVGLQLALYGVGIIVPISYLESIGFGVFTIAVYFVAATCIPPDWATDRSLPPT
jgi:two-component system, sensor histidine kinase PhcS